MSVPPLPMSTDGTGDRWLEQRRRRALLEGGWRELLAERVKTIVGSERRSAWGYLDMSANPFRQLCDQFATLYDSEPSVTNADASESELADFEEALELSGFWAFMQRVQRDTVGLRDLFVRFDVDDDGTLVFEEIWPDYVRDVVYDAAGRQIRSFAYLVPRTDPTDMRTAWFWDVFTLTSERDRDVGQVQVLRDRGGVPDPDRDMSRHFLVDVDGDKAPDGGLVGDAYPYRNGEGSAFIPIVRYRAEVLGSRTWDWQTWIEVVEGSLNVAAYWSFWGHLLRNASWPQRYSIGVVARSSAILAQEEGPGVRAIVTDPATLLEFDVSEGFTGQPTVSNFAPGGDVEATARSVQTYEARIAAGVGVGPSDLMRTSDPRSGYSIAISREAQRESQRRLKPAFRQGDILALGIIAVLLNRVRDEQVPERGWRPDYVSLPLSAEERRALREEVFAELDRGFLDEVEALRRLRGYTLSRAAAKAELERIKAQDEDDDPPAPPPVPPAPPVPPTPPDDPGDPE